MLERKVIALFGATDSTGGEFLKLALHKGYVVKALVNDPKKIDEKSEKLHVVKGNFTNTEEILYLLEKADYVIIMACSKGSLKDNRMYNLVKTIHALLPKTNQPKIIYQARAICHIPNKKKNRILKLLRSTLTRWSGIEKGLADHDKTLKYIEGNIKPDGIKVIVTLPSAMGLNKGSSKKDLTIHAKLIFKKSTHIDVARFILKNLDNDQLNGRYVYLA